MTLSPGARLGPYEIQAAIGAGGMGEVTLEVGAVRALFETRPQKPGYVYDVSADGQRFLIATTFSEKNSSPVTLVVNWTAGLRH